MLKYKNVLEVTLSLLSVKQFHPFSLNKILKDSQLKNMDGDTWNVQENFFCFN